MARYSGGFSTPEVALAEKNYGMTKQAFQNIGYINAQFGRAIHFEPVMNLTRQKGDEALGEIKARAFASDAGTDVTERWSVPYQAQRLSTPKAVAGVAMAYQFERLVAYEGQRGRLLGLLHIFNYGADGRYPVNDTDATANDWAMVFEPGAVKILDNRNPAAASLAVLDRRSPQAEHDVWLQQIGVEFHELATSPAPGGATGRERAGNAWSAIRGVTSRHIDAMRHGAPS